ncbi:MAG: 4-(cytidine 5'-diphospho)-2-C-methyl-D-erythritol kinase [Vicinamibacterales bacterium]
MTTVAPGRQVTVRAHAKINLDLRVLGIRADGFHELRTVFQAISLHDIVTCVPRPGPFAIECRTAGVPLNESNLVWRAAERLWHSLRRPGRVADVLVQLDKRIPLQGGLGGGSADAAATLVGLARLWRVPVKATQLVDIGATLGADVPFFLSGGTALGLGRGEEIYPLADLPTHWVVLLVPGFGVSTVDAYGWWDTEHAQNRTPEIKEPQYVPGPWPSRAAQMVNDLEAPIARHHPEIDQMKAALRRAGALAASMTGSGSTVFGLFQKRADAVRAVARLDGLGWRVILTKSLGRVESSRLTRPVLSSGSRAGTR